MLKVFSFTLVAIHRLWLFLVHTKNTHILNQLTSFSSNSVESSNAQFIPKCFNIFKLNHGSIFTKIFLKQSNGTVLTISITKSAKRFDTSRWHNFHAKSSLMSLSKLIREIYVNCHQIVAISFQRFWIGFEVYFYLACYILALPQR